MAFVDPGNLIIVPKQKPRGTPQYLQARGFCLFYSTRPRRKGAPLANSCMEHRGVRYAIRMGIERERWRVAIHLPGNVLPEERTVWGTRKDAEVTARSMIDAWLRKKKTPITFDGETN